MQPREPGVILMASGSANPPVTRTPDKRGESPDCSPRKTDEIQSPQPHSPVWICQCPQSKAHFPAHWSSLPLIYTTLYAASSDPALPWPPAPFHDPFHTSKCLYGLGAFPKGSPHPLNVAPKDAVFPVVFSVTLFLFSHPMLLRPKGGAGILWGPQTACRTVRPSGYPTLIHCWTHQPLASGSCPFLENDPTTAASSWSTLTSGGHPLQHPNLSSPLP